MTTSVFDETSLHQAIIEVWGEHGAHNDVMRALRTDHEFLTNEVEALRDVVRQLAAWVEDLDPDPGEDDCEYLTAHHGACRRALDDVTAEHKAAS